MPQKLVLMKHPKLPDGPHNPRQISLTAFKQVWEGKGWKLVETKEK
jgi:hypothetical protein